MMREIRWQVADWIIIVSIGTLSTFCLWSAFKHQGGALSLGALGVAVWVALSARHFVNMISSAASEVMADSIALRRPYFITGDKWKERAENQAKRLEGELQQLNPAHDRYLQVALRCLWLRRWLKLETVAPYHSADVDPRFLLAAVLLVVAGFFSNLSSSMMTAMLLGTYAAAFFGLLQLAPNAMRSHAAAMAVHEAIKQKLSRN
jgi:hypothetical protein